MKLANKIALVERRIKENKGGKYGLEVEARLEWAKMKKDKGIVDEDREARKKAFFQKKKRRRRRASQKLLSRWSRKRRLKKNCVYM